MTTLHSEVLRVVPSEPAAPAPAPSVPDGQLVEFVEPIPGFAAERHFVLAPIDSAGVLFSLRSLNTPGLRFVVMPPHDFFPDYHPAVDESDLLPLGDISDTELQLLVIITVQNGISDATANLLAPIVLVPSTGQAMQLVLADAQLPLRAPLLAAAS